MLKERCYAFGEDACWPNKALHFFDLGSTDADYCHCGGHQLGIYTSRYLEVPDDAPPENATLEELLAERNRFAGAVSLIDMIRSSGNTLECMPAGMRVLTAEGVILARAEGTSADCLRQLAGQLKQ